MTTTPIKSVTDELLAEIERVYLAGWEASGEGWNAEYPGDAHETKPFIGRMQQYCLPLTTELRHLRAEVEALRKVCKDVAWRVSDTCDQLQATGFDGDRRYGLDEWSAPIKNLNMAVGILERAMQSNTEGK